MTARDRRSNSYADMRRVSAHVGSECTFKETRLRILSLPTESNVEGIYEPNVVFAGSMNIGSNLHRDLDRVLSSSIRPLTHFDKEASHNGHHYRNF